MGNVLALMVTDGLDILQILQYNCVLLMCFSSARVLRSATRKSFWFTLLVVGVREEGPHGGSLTICR